MLVFGRTAPMTLQSHCRQARCRIHASDATSRSLHRAHAVRQGAGENFFRSVDLCCKRNRPAVRRQLCSRRHSRRKHNHSARRRLEASRTSQRLPTSQLRTHRFHAGGTETWTVSRVNRQDWNICERVQGGMHARPFTRGNYAPIEDMSLDIRNYIAERLGNDLPPD